MKKINSYSNWLEAKNPFEIYQKKKQNALSPRVKHGKRLNLLGNSSCFFFVTVNYSLLRKSKLKFMFHIVFLERR